VAGAVYGGPLSVRIGGGLPPAQGLLTCGEFGMTPQMSISARNAIPSPGGGGAGAEMRGGGGCLGPAGAAQKKMRLGTMSLRPSPWRASSFRKFSRQPVMPLTPYISSFDCALQQPAIVSWKPQLSPMTVIIGRATSE